VWSRGDDTDQTVQLATLAEHMPVVLNDLVGPALPEHTEHAWRAFVELASTRTSGAHGANPITYETIAAFQRVTGETLTDLELACVFAADRAIMHMQHDRLHAAAATASPDPPE
jgi:hypothetical protein